MKLKTSKKKLFNGWHKYVYHINTKAMIRMNNRSNNSLDFFLIYLKMIQDGTNGN